MGCLQIYSSKSQTLKSASLFAVYPIHIALLSFTETIKQKQIVSSASLATCLLFGYSGGDHGTRKKWKEVCSWQICNTASIMYCSLLRNVLSGLLCKTSDNGYFLLHLVIVSYVTDIPESEDLLSVKRNNHTAMPCYMCEVKKREAFIVY